MSPKETILIVDDEPAILKLVHRILTREGYACTTAECAGNAREILEERSFSLILCDINMPGESGLSFIGHVTATYPETATVMMTALYDAALLQSALDNGVYDYINKPIERRRLTASVANALHRRHLEADNRGCRSNLEEMVSKRTLELATKKRELEETLDRLKETQVQMIHAEKMASIGQLASGVAHEINNPASFVISNLNTFKDYLKDMDALFATYGALAASLGEAAENTRLPGEVRRSAADVAARKDAIDLDYLLADSRNLVDESLQGMERIRKIVSDLKDFAHPGKRRIEHANVNDLLESTLNIAWNELKYKAKVRRDFRELPEVPCYPQKINQVFMNVLVNAAQAMEQEGRIDIATRALGDRVEIRISDTGPGIPPELRSKVFDPFFTTKPVGKGTGMGLNIAWHIVRDHGGTIDVQSAASGGAAFTIVLPLERREPEGPPSGPAAPER